MPWYLEMMRFGWLLLPGILSMKAKFSGLPAAVIVIFCRQQKLSVVVSMSLVKKQSLQTTYHHKAKMLKIRLKRSLIRLHTKRPVSFIHVSGQLL